jgi:hypothetical protein
MPPAERPLLGLGVPEMNADYSQQQREVRRFLQVKRRWTPQLGPGTPRSRRDK